MNKIKDNLRGFSLIEFIIVIIILVMLTVLTSASINYLREANRNAKRVADIMEIQVALEMYKRGEGGYPPLGEVAFGFQLKSQASNTIYMQKIPLNPQPSDDGVCDVNAYNYQVNADQSSYTLDFCLGSRSGDVGPGNNTAIPGDILSCIPNCVKSCDEGANTGDDGCGTICPNTVPVCSIGDTCLNNHCITNI